MTTATQTLATQYLAALRSGERQTASRMVLDAVHSGTASVQDIYLNVFRSSQYEVGRLWSEGKMSVAEEHYCTAATQLIMSQLYPHIFSRVRRGKTLVATSVAGELHEMPIRMVADFFEMAGWNTYYLGTNTPARDVVSTVRDRKADVVAISATMEKNVKHVQTLVHALRDAVAGRADNGLPRLRIMVGGWPFSADPLLVEQVGADGYADNAQDAIELAERWVS
jgi:methanogenic corrinoid protein MtbC1